jgi:ATP synthase F1 delta subunit
MSQLQAVVTDKAVAAKFSKVSAEYYASLVKKGTTSQLPAVAAALQELFLVSKGFDIADVTSAVSLSKQEQQDLEAAMSKEHAKTGRKLHFRYAVNPTIMGGFTIQINEHFWDLSIETQVKNAMAL